MSNWVPNQRCFSTQQPLGKWSREISIKRSRSMRLDFGLFPDPNCGRMHNPQSYRIPACRRPPSTNIHEQTKDRSVMVDDVWRSNRPILALQLETTAIGASPELVPAHPTSFVSVSNMSISSSCPMKMALKSGKCGFLAVLSLPVLLAFFSQHPRVELFSAAALCKSRNSGPFPNVHISAPTGTAFR